MAYRTGKNAIHRLLEDTRIRAIQLQDQRYHAAADVVAVLAICLDPQAEWDKIKAADSALRAQCVRAEVGGELQDVLNLSAILRLIQRVDSPEARRLQGWLAEVAARHVEEEADPELAVQRMRQSYVGQGRTRRWIDQRLRSISARQEIVSEWYQRGVKESGQFRELTNQLMEATFGMDVTELRRSKGFVRNLRDHLTDLELSLLSLAESTAASLHRSRKSNGMNQLLSDIKDAGCIMRETRLRIENAADDRRGGIAA